ncbi:hypothetical protein V6Z12_D04G089500 [Gossypium hirsutum]
MKTCKRLRRGMWLMIILDPKTNPFEFLPIIPEQDFFVWLWKVTLKLILVKDDSGGLHHSDSTILEDIIL